MANCNSSSIAKGRLVMNDFNDNAKEIKRKASELLKTAKEKAGNAYYETKPKADELAAQIGNTAVDLYQSGKQEINRAEKYLEDSIACTAHSIQRKPLASVLIAAGIGYLFAKIFK